VREQSVGYLSFTLYGLARLFAVAPDLPLWRDDGIMSALRRSVAFADQHIFNLRSGQNRYAYSYNPTGIEMAYVKQAFGGLLPPGRSAGEWLALQLDRHYDRESGLMNRATGDPNTFAARIYELYPLRDTTVP